MPHRIRPAALLMMIQLALMFGTLLVVCASVRQALLLPMIQRGFYSAHSAFRMVMRPLPSQTIRGMLGNIQLPQFSVHYTQSEALLGVRGIYFSQNATTPPLESGRFFTTEEMNSERALAVVGRAQLEEVYERDGRRWLEVAGTPFEVIGVMGMNTQTRLDPMMWVPLCTALSLTDGTGVFRLDAPTPKDVQTLGIAMDKMTGDKESAAIDAAINDEPINQARSRALKKMNHTTQLLIAVIALYGLALAGVLGWWLNTKRKRIGIQQVLGFSQMEVLRGLLWDFTKLFALAGGAALAVLMIAAPPAPQDVLLCAGGLYGISIAVMSLHMLVRRRAQRREGRVLL